MALSGVLIADLVIGLVSAGLKEYEAQAKANAEGRDVDQAELDAAAEERKAAVDSFTEKYG